VLVNPTQAFVQELSDLLGAHYVESEIGVNLDSSHPMSLKNKRSKKSVISVTSVTLGGNTGYTK